MVQIGLFTSGGRRVRCARCGHEWHATLSTKTDVFVSLPEAPPVVVPVEAQAVTQTHASFASASATAIGGAASILKREVVANLPAVVKEWNWKRFLLRGLGYATFAILLVAWPIYDRQPIVKAFPALRGIYESLGAHIPHSGVGLTFDQVKSELRYDGGTMRLYVDGVVHNSTAEIQFIPDIKARAIGPDQRIIQSWWVPAPAATVDAGGDAPFHTEVSAPMQRTIADVYLEFYAQDEKTDVSQ